MITKTGQAVHASGLVVVKSMTKVLSSVAAASIFLFPLSGWASHCENSIATAISVQGIVEEKIENQWTPVKRGDGFCAGDMVRVREKSRAIVRMHAEQTNITLSHHTTRNFCTQKQ